ncbi:MAG: PASTA domain-containing protein [Phycisphaerales bacterium]
MAATFTTSKWFVGTMVVCLLAGICGGVEFAGGTGEPNDPYQIATAEQLISIGSDPNLLSRHFVLVSDVDLDPDLPGGRVFDSPVVAGGQEWPDGVDPNFTGTLDGRGFKVRNLTICAPADGDSALGLFGRIGRGAQVQNLGMDRVLINREGGATPAGGLAGVNWGLIRACYATGSVTGGERVGGLCGENRGGISSCYAGVAVTAERFAGGLVGYAAIGAATRRVGGDAGSAANCYARGSVQAREGAGGLAGGGGGYASACFWDVQTSGQKTGAVGAGLMTFQMMDAFTYANAGWDRDANWVIDNGRDYPRLAWEGTKGQPIRNQLSYRLEGTGTPLDPYHVATAEQFALLGLVSGPLNSHFVLDADLDLTDMLVRPISSFNGFLHGNRHILRHLTFEIGEPVVQASETYGLFADIGRGGRVSCLGLEDVSVRVAEGSHTIGVLAARNEGVVTGCYATGVVHAGQHESTIGLIGVNAGVLARSYVRLEVRGSNAIGCLVGRNSRPYGSSTRGEPARTTYWGLILECYTVLCTLQVDARDYLAVVNDELASSLNSYCLTPWEAEERNSFMGWDFAGSSSDGTADRWYMPDADYPVLSWQVDVDGYRPVPDIFDLPLDWATTELELAGFVVGRILYDYHSAIPKERAILTSPVGLAPVGSTVDIIASQGVYTLPAAASSSSYSPVLLSYAQLDTPGQIECLAGRFAGDAVVILGGDIDMTGWDVLPLSSQSSNPPYQTSLSSSFGGVFLGDGHTISHLTNCCGEGFFDQISPDGFVQELRLEDVFASSSKDTSVGALAAENLGIVLHCGVSGAVVGSESTSNLGGLVGVNSGLIEGCSVDAAVCGSQSEQSDPKAGPRNVGGVVGCNKGDLIDSHARGEVSGLARIGGLLGTNDGSVMGSYAAVHITTSEQKNVGGLVGYNGFSRSRGGQGAPLPVTDCYWLGAADSEGLDNGHGMPLSDTQMKQQASFAGWDFENTWTICEEMDYPRLRWEGLECEDGQ